MPNMFVPAVNKDAITTAKFSLLRILWGKVLGGRNEAVVENRLCQDTDFDKLELSTSLSETKGVTIYRYSAVSFCRFNILVPMQYTGTLIKNTGLSLYHSSPVFYTHTACFEHLVLRM